MRLPHRQRGVFRRRLSLEDDLAGQSGGLLSASGGPGRTTRGSSADVVRDSGGALLAAITLFVLWNLRRRPYLAVGWFWYLGTLVPVIGLIQVGAQGMADRYTYLPMIGVTIMVVWGGRNWRRDPPSLRMAMGVAAGILLAAWTVLTVRPGLHLEEPATTVFQHAIDVTSDNYFAHNHLGLAYQSEARQRIPEKADNDEYDELLGRSTTRRFVICPELRCVQRESRRVLHEPQAARTRLLVFREGGSSVNPYAAFHHANLAGAYIALNRLDEAGRSVSRGHQDRAGYRRAIIKVWPSCSEQQKTAKAIAELTRCSRSSTPRTTPSR